MNITFLNNSALDWVAALTVAVLVTAGLHAVKTLLQRRLELLAPRTETKLDDVALKALRGTSVLVMLLVGIYAGATLLNLPERSTLIITRIAVTAALFQVARWGDRALGAWLLIYRAARADDPGRATSTAALGFVFRIVLWAVLLLMVLDNLGFNITTLVASLGIGGIAVALAAQQILGDLFASLSIVLDKPFVIGDFINVNGVMGTVEHVGLKTTRVRSLSGEQIIFSNNDLLKSRIHNLKRMETRRAVFTFGVPYGTLEPELRAIAEMVREKIKAQEPAVTFDRAHFSGFGPAALTFEAVYIVNSPDYVVHMNLQQEILLHVYTALQERGVPIALPAQVLHLADVRTGANDPAGGAPEERAA
ncbi:MULTISPECIES: mechanosensitive ion channel family protein [unclassified Massilia]|uniref:mechanosensitive ion channel family protein n=1 Tax=unclassified Massilia TaxID=2609279 RepID=UPI001780BDB3|nr:MULTISPECIES: mechanosensitive ion channel family protein [unclassified Massilia]MBD8533188.1 mechanosensitive ion channel [Massilia sp. CFBP 13647]MBD8676643.1 mechanosensitive ion channel [Massilia sp. CFBP 13721]